MAKEQKQAGYLDEKAMVEYENKISKLDAVLSDAGRDPNACTNWVSVRIDLLAMAADEASLEKVSHE